MSKAAPKEQTALVRSEEAPASNAIATMTPMDMVEKAIATGSGVEVIEKLMALQERWEKNQARKAFDNAMANAKAEIPVIIKNRKVGFDSKRTGERTSYKHEDLAEIARTVDPVLAAHGLSYRYRTEMKDGGLICVTCIVSHRDGHSEETMLPATRDDSGSKNNLQAIGSTVTYLQRYTLKAALGLAAASDDDAVSAEVSFITDEQSAHLIAICDEIGADKRAFCEYFNIDGIAMLPADKYDRAIAMLGKKRAKDAKAKEPAQ